MATRTCHRPPDGKLVIHTGSRWSDGIFAPAIFLEKYIGDQPVPDPRATLAACLAESQSSHKPVLVALGADGCLPCRQLDEFLQEQQKIVAKRFVVLRADVGDERSLGVLIRDRYRASRGTAGYVHYYPWIAFLNANGNVLVTGDDGPAGLIGLPQGNAPDRTWFLNMLRAANPEITEAEIAQLSSAAEAYHKRIWSSRRTDG
jgi:hypothetical protein